MIPAATTNRMQQLLNRICPGTTSTGDHPIKQVFELPGREAEFAEWPSWVNPQVMNAVQESRPTTLWKHQADAATKTFHGQHVVIATGTASGKSLCYQLPILSTLLNDPLACALYLSPTKALAANQLQAVSALGLPNLKAARYDGDTPQEERDWSRAFGRWLFTNPDMLHRSIAPNHDKWARFFRKLSYVVIDECHGYRGVFGSHIALLLRRIMRLARYYGAQPTFVLTSATSANPADFAEKLTGEVCTAITEDHSPAAPKTVVLWQPPLLDDFAQDHENQLRRSANTEAAHVLANLVIEGTKSLVFVRSRKGAELTALTTKRLLNEVDTTLGNQVAAYRSGFLPEERRELEKALLTGSLRGVATTNALELGVNITGLDAVVLAGYPGTVASFWQQAGRAGRSGQQSLVLFIAGDDPLDSYLVHNAEALNRPVETAVLDPLNPYVLEPQLACAAAELPLTVDDLSIFGGTAAEKIIADLVQDRVLRKRPKGWYWALPRRPHYDVDIRGAGGNSIAVVEKSTSRLLGSVDFSSACQSVFPGAVYLHQGDSYVVDELDLSDNVALVHADTPDWHTSPRTIVDISVMGIDEQIHYSGVTRCLGDVSVTSQVVGFLKKLPSGKVLEQVPLDLPQQELCTKAVWYTISADLLKGKGPGRADLVAARIPGSLHAAEHAAIGLLPLFATCDRWDIGGVSTILHPDTGEATVFVHDGHFGGAGFAERGHAAFIPWLTATREAIMSCECPTGCPSCVQSPKCGNGNEPLDKAGAVAVLDVVLEAVNAQPLTPPQDD